MAIKSFKRYEKKFILDKEQYNKLIPKLLEYMTPDKYCKSGKNYNIYNIYYDTEHNDVIRHSISKPFYKEKLRLRSYKIPSNPSDKVFLELKKKINGIVNKRRVLLTLEEAYKFLELGERPCSNDYINTQVLNEIEYYLNNNPVKPTVYIGYTRNAFFAKDDPDFRLTFDPNIISRRNNLSLEFGNSGDDGLNYGLTDIYDVIILDIMQPKLNGLQVLRMLRKKGISTPIILLTAKDSVKDKVTGLDLGADDYLPKPFSSEELLARLRALTRRKGEVINDNILDFGDIRLSLSTYDLECKNNSITLTLKEFDILHYFMQRPKAL